MSIHPVYLVKGDDSSLVNEAVGALVNELLGDRNADMALQEIPEDSDVEDVLDACQTPAFLTDLRIVLVRNAGRFRAGAVEPVIEYLKSPMPSTALVLVAGGGAIPTRLLKAIKDHGHSIDVSVPSGKARQSWFNERLKKGPVRLDAQAAALLGEHLAEELGQVTAVLNALAAAYGEGARVSIEELQPFIGVGGAAAPWELTDAIDCGDTATALAQLRRMLGAGQRHPLVVIASLQRHVGNLLRLDGSDVADERQASALLGISPYPAKKALAQARRMGSERILRAVRLVSEADVDLRGARAWPGELLLEVLVARLSHMAPSSRKSPAGQRRAG